MARVSQLFIFDLLVLLVNESEYSSFTGTQPILVFAPGALLLLLLRQLILLLLLRAPTPPRPPLG